MKQLLIAELQKLQKKATENFKEAEKENSPLGAGYFYISKKIHGIIGTIQGFEKTTPKKLESLRDMHTQAKKFIEKFGNYKIDISAEIDADGIFKYSGRLKGTLKGGSASYDYEYLVNHLTFSTFLEELEDKLKKDMEARKELPTDEDIKVK
ncbi:MAG: hypothetical protein N4A59_06290 [Marinifilum sp.]|jgi:hypothetical protein|nr:hypothetical protein [Marinifilum sp.]